MDEGLIAPAGLIETSVSSVADHINGHADELERLRDAEEKIGSALVDHGSRLFDHESRLNGLIGDTGRVEARVTSHDGDIAVLHEAVCALTIEVWEQQNAIDALGSRLRWALASIGGLLVAVGGLWVEIAL